MNNPFHPSRDSSALPGVAFDDEAAEGTRAMGEIPHCPPNRAHTGPRIASDKFPRQPPF